MAYIRGSNPVWSYVDLTGKQFDDTFYMYVLQNTIPYLPTPVWHDPNGNVEWDNPIQFLANGTLPIDIYWDPTVVYRLEFRQNDGLQPPSQADALIYLVENYVPGSGSTPVDNFTFTTTNQITNPQFSLVNFASPFTLTNVTDPDSIELAPGWFLDLVGTGSVTLTQVPLNNSAGTLNPTNAPYALQMTLSGTWSSAILRQRFDINGMLWANKVVSASITARIEGAPQTILANLVDSNGTTLGDVIPSTLLNSTFNQYAGFAELGDTTNPNLPPAAWIEYQLVLPTSVDIFVTSFQLLAQNLPVELLYEQDSIQRQQDHTFHYYRDSIILQPKPSIAVGWNFPLNPWQFRTTASSTITASQYTADQTIVALQNASSLEAGRSSEGYFNIQSVTSAAQGKFAVIQYIDALSAAPLWASKLSALVKAAITTAHGTALQVKMRIIYRSNVPPAVDPISSWAATDPVFTAGWTAIAPKVDNVGVIDSATFENFIYEGFQLPARPSATAMIGIVLYTVNTMDSAAVADLLRVRSISVAANDFAIDVEPEAYNDTLSKCQFYYEKSYAQNILPGNAIAGGPLYAFQTPRANGGNTEMQITAFGFQFRQNARTTNPTIILWSPLTANLPNFVLGNTASSAAGNTANVAITNWSEIQKSSTGVSFQSNNFAAGFVPCAGTSFSSAWIYYHYTKDARLGLVA